jgi:uncharacterized Tic20 family protein
MSEIDETNTQELPKKPRRTRSSNKVSTDASTEQSIEQTSEKIADAEVIEETVYTNTASKEVLSPDNDEKNIATITHLGGIVLFFIPALAVWLLKKQDSAYIEAQSREALNFQVTVMIAMFAANILVWLLIGFLLIPAIWLGNIAFCILAAVATSRGENYRYPFSLRLIN